MYDKKKVSLDPETQGIFENGVALGKYLVILKELMVTHFNHKIKIETKQSRFEHWLKQVDISQTIALPLGKIIQLEYYLHRARCN